MNTGTIFSVSMAVGMSIALIIGQKYLVEGLIVGLVAGALIVRIKNKKNEK